MAVTVLLADDHPVVLSGLRHILGREADLHVVGEARDGCEVVPLVERLRPDVLLLDLKLPGRNGLDLTRELTERALETRVLFLSFYATAGYAQEALACGAFGYLGKDADGPEVVHAIREVASGRRYFSPPLPEAPPANGRRRISKCAASGALLTDRENEVLALLAAGCTSVEIAERLYLSARTVQGHRSTLMRKLGARTAAELIHSAMQRGLLPDE
jgi:DNA-binding NarL/FixJ family response regulator